MRTPWFRVYTTPASAMRYPTVGDWQMREDPEAQAYVGEVTVADLSDPQHPADSRVGHWNFLVALHELVEMYLCCVRRVPEATVDAFDLAWPTVRPRPPLPPGDEDCRCPPADRDLAVRACAAEEPGLCRHCPYRAAHEDAMAVEELVARQLGLTAEDLLDYDVRCTEVEAAIRLAQHPPAPPKPGPPSEVPPCDH